MGMVIKAQTKLELFISSHEWMQMYALTHSKQAGEFSSAVLVPVQQTGLDINVTRHNWRTALWERFWFCLIWYGDWCERQKYSAEIIYSFIFWAA